MSDEAAPLRELAVAEYAAELPSDAALEPDVAHEVPLGYVGPGASGTLPFAAGVPDLAAHRATVTVQREDVGVALAAARAHVGLVGLGYPGGGALKHQPRVVRAPQAGVERRRRVVGDVGRRRQARFQVHPKVQLVLWK